jgi:hypothetical protein
MKCQISTFNAHGSSIILIIIQTRIVKLYVVVVEEVLKVEIYRNMLLIVSPCRIS